MMPLSKWEPCLADMDRNVSFFDGITIETDRITDPRADRVLPILAEEQVYMCRMMAPLLRARSGARVLDIGTGSGVFALQAAKLGCRVIAIDISPRALRFAHRNAEINQIPTVDREPAPGEIRFRHCSYEYIEEEKNSFDFVLLAPPYNPTCPGIQAALHASAGVLGQDSFAKQLPIAASFLKHDGICIGNQMVPAKENRTPVLPKILNECFSGGTFGYQRILRKDVSIKDFLEQQYESYLNPLYSLKPQPRAVRSYIDKHFGNDKFALLYFELSPDRENALSGRQVTQIRLEESISELDPPRNWDDRIKLHRRIVEHSSPNDSFPVPALFLDIDALPDFLQHDSSLVATEKVWAESVFRYVELWLIREGLFGSKDKKGLLDLLLIDTAPWYPTPAGRKGLQQESVVWASHRLETKEVENFLTMYQDNTSRQQLTRTGPFLHGGFTGKIKNKAGWGNIEYTVHDQLSALDDSSNFDESVHVRKLIESLNTCNPKPPDTSIVNPNSRLRAMYSHSDLLALGVPDVDEFDKVVKSRIEQLKLSPNWKDASTQDLFAQDLGICHQAMHWRLDSLLPDVELQPSRSTSLMGLPISLASLGATEEASNGRSSLPDDYRGGVWIYAVAQGFWTPEMDRYLLDISRLLMMLFETKYSQQAAKELRRVGGLEAKSAIFHQIPKDIAALLRSLDNLRNAAKKNPDCAAIINLIPRPDEMAFMTMVADASVNRPTYMLLPPDVPERLQIQGCNFELICEIYQRFVWSYVLERIRAVDILKSKDFVKDRNLKPEQFAAKYPIPEIQRFQSFHLPNAQDTYIWLILALRSAAVHAYLPVVTGETGATKGRIVIEYNQENGQGILEISNTGLAPLPGLHKDQIGWRRDISVFKRDGQNWQVLEVQDRQFSVWNPTRNLWITRIVQR